MTEHDDGEQGPDTDGLAADGDAYGRLAELSLRTTRALLSDNELLRARIARKEAANEALYAKLEATMADMRSLQRQNDNWRAECTRLSALLIENERKLAQRMAIPARALRHGGVR